MKRRFVVSVLAIGVSLTLGFPYSEAQTVHDFTDREPTVDELKEALKPRTPPPFRIKPGTRGIGAVATKPPVAAGKPRCAHYRRQASRGIGLKADSDIAALQVTFAYNSAELTPEATRTLSTLGEALQSDELTSCCFQIEGHTDDRGTDAYNLGLSERRAQSVARYLQNTFGIERDRLLTVGYGEKQPITDNETDEGRQKNRRVQVVNLGYEQPAEP